MCVLYGNEPITKVGLCPPIATYYCVYYHYYSYPELENPAGGQADKRPPPGGPRSGSRTGHPDVQQRVQHRLPQPCGGGHVLEAHTELATTTTGTAEEGVAGGASATARREGVIE